MYLYVGLFSPRLEGHVFLSETCIFYQILNKTSVKSTCPCIPSTEVHDGSKLSATRAISHFYVVM